MLQQKIEAQRGYDAHTTEQGSDARKTRATQLHVMRTSADKPGTLSSILGASLHLPKLGVVNPGDYWLAQKAPCEFKSYPKAWEETRDAML